MKTRANACWVLGRRSKSSSQPCCVWRLCNMPKRRSDSTAKSTGVTTGTITGGASEEETISPIHRLQSLANDPDEQMTFALSLLSPGRPRDVLQAALQIAHLRPTSA